MKFLIPLEKLFHQLVNIKNALYNLGLLNSIKLQVPVISVGNLSFGGVGKTPCVIFLAEELVKTHQINIIAKSYKANLTTPAKVDLNLENAARLFGDESCLIQFKLPNCQVWSGPQKYHTAVSSLRDRPQLIILDDGFSHRKLHRNFDLVLVDATQGFKTLLREPLSSLTRAQAVLITKINLSNSEIVTEIKKNITALAPHLADSIFLSGVETELKSDNTTPLFVFCGLGRPETFIQDLTLQGYKVVHQKFFADHHLYSPTEQQNLFAEYRKLQLKYKTLKLVTTEKDLTKLSDNFLRTNLIVPDHKMVMDQDQKEALLAKIRQSL